MEIQFRDTYNKQSLSFEIDRVFTEIKSYMLTISPEDYYTHAFGGWSVAENISHIILVNNLVTILFSMPRFLFSTFIGVNQPKRSKEVSQLFIEYHSALKTPRDSGIFSPWIERKPGNPEKKMKASLNNFMKSGRYLADAIHSWKEEHLDYYLTLHPVMGAVTLREMAYLTVLHCLHHTSKVYDKVHIEDAVVS